MKFRSPEDELQFLRAVVRVTRLVDDILEDCIDQQLGLAAALDVFLAQVVRMVPARAAFVQLRGTRGPVIARVSGRFKVDVEALAEQEGAIPLESGVAYVRPLNLGKTRVGALGFWLEGSLDDGRVMALVDTMAEQLDSALLGFMALSEGRTPLERLDELNDALQFLPQARLGRYELVCPLGAGGMAQVMVARTLGPEGVSRLVALKRILPHLCADADVIQQFLDEARLAMRLTHPNLVTVHDFGQSGSAYFIAMELVRGVDLHDLVHGPGRPMPPALASTALTQALRGLHAAHHARAEDGALLELVHRDLSPSNLMVGFDGWVKVMDFGVAKARARRTITQPGLVKGKPLYMAPEQAVADPIDRRADLFAMGLILHEAITGELPFRRDTDVATMEAIVNDPLPVAHGVPPQLWEVIERALQKDPARRFPDAQQMAQALAAAAPPASADELGRYVALQFPDRLKAVGDWERPQPLRDVAMDHTRVRAGARRSG